MTEICREPLRTPATWRGPELQRSTDWLQHLSADEVADLERGLAHARATGKPMTELTREDFPLPVLEPVIRGWLQTLQQGRGFLNVKGVPVAGRDDEDAAWFQWGNVHSACASNRPTGPRRSQR